MFNPTNAVSSQVAARDQHQLKDMNASEHLRVGLANTGPKTLEEILRDYPGLQAVSLGADVWRLLLRLDPRFRLLPDGRWSIVTAAQTSRQRIAAAAQVYLEQIPGNGARIATAVEHVTSETGYDEALVLSAILEHFETSGNLVRSRLRAVK